jgi:hypothetical protein
MTLNWFDTWRLEQKIAKAKRREIWLKTKAGRKYTKRHRARLEHTVVTLLRKSDGNQFRIERTMRVTV